MIRGSEAVKRYCILLLILELLCIRAFAENKLMEEVPEWLQGTLCLNTIGETSLSDKTPYGQSICFFNFTDRSITSLQVPSGTMLTQDLESGLPIIVYSVNNSYLSAEYTSGHHPRKWRRYSVDRFLRSENNDTFEMEEVCYFDCLDSPLAILGIDGALSFYTSKQGIAIYNLSYAIDDANELVIQLGSTTIASYLSYPKGIIEQKSYRNFPLSYDMGSFYYAISDGGKIALLERSDKIWISDGENSYLLPDSETYSFGSYWLNDVELLYTACIYKPESWSEDPVYELRIWNDENRKYECLKTLDGNNVTLNELPNYISLNASRDCLAMYFAPPMLGTAHIRFLNLETGAIYVFKPWQHECKLSNGETLLYGISDDGAAFYESVDMMEPQILWYDE